MIAALEGHRLAEVRLLDCGTFSVRKGERVITIPAFLLTTDRGARVLVDGGFPPEYGTDPEAAATRDGLGSFGALMDHGPARTVTGQLALCGLTPADLAAHVLTHGHIDHVGALPLIACPLILTAAERSDPRPCYYGAARPVVWPGVDTRRLRGDTRLCCGIDLIPTPGHTPGHLSLILTPPEGPRVILAADAINRASEPAEGFADAADPALAAASATRLLDLAGPDARLIWGHDPVQGPGLPRAPARLA